MQFLHCILLSFLGVPETTELVAHCSEWIYLYFQGTCSTFCINCTCMYLLRVYLTVIQVLCAVYCTLYVRTYTAPVCTCIYVLYTAQSVFTCMFFASVLSKGPKFLLDCTLYTLKKVQTPKSCHTVNCPTVTVENFGSHFVCCILVALQVHYSCIVGSRCWALQIANVTWSRTIS